MILFDCKNTKIILLFNDNVCFFLILTAKNFLHTPSCLVLVFLGGS